MKKPIVVWLAEAGMLLAALANASLAMRCALLLVRPENTLARSLPGLLIGAGVALLSVFLLVDTREQRTTRRRVLLFFWGILLLYPLTNILTELGYFPLRPVLPPEQLGGAAASELLRYAALLALIVWLMFSKAAAVFLAAKRQAAAAKAAAVPNTES